MRAEVRGRITLRGPDRAGVYRWEITADHRATAETLTTALSGVLSADGDGWRVVTSDSRLRVHVAADSAGGLLVVFGGVPGAAFLLAVPTWQRERAFDIATADLLARSRVAPAAELAADQVLVTTRGGRLVRFCIPRVTALESTVGAGLGGQQLTIC